MIDWFALLCRYDATIARVDMGDAAAVAAMEVAVENAPRPIRERVRRRWLSRKAARAPKAS
jgi:hypothetical protein